MARKGTLDQTVTPWEPTGGGEMGDLIRRYDWMATPLGSMTSWPQSVRMAVDLMLTMRQPACIWWGEEPRLLYNDEYRTILHSKHPAALGQTMSEVWPDLLGSQDHPLDVVRAHGPQLLVDREFILDAGGERHSRWFTSTWTPLHDEAGTVIGVFNVSTETTNRVLAERALQESEEWQAFQLNLSDALASIASSADIQAEAGRILGERLDAAWCYFNEFDATGTHATVLRDFHRDGLPSMVGVHDLSHERRFLELVSSGGVLDMSDLATSTLFSPEAKEHYGAMGLRSALGVPLLQKGRLIAVLLAADTRVRTWTEGDIALLAGAAERTWAAIVRLRDEAAQRASEARQAFLLKLSDDFRADPDEASIGQACVEGLARHMGVDRCYIAELAEDRDEAVVTAEYRSAGWPAILGTHKISAYPGALQHFRDDMPLVSSDVCNDPTLSEPDRAAIGEGLNIKAIISTPLRRREGNIIWSLTVGTEVSREWSSEDLRLVQDVAERAWGAIERARTESALRVSEERYQTLFEASPVPFMVLAPNPPDFTILAANEAYYEATLRTPETLLGRRLFDVFSDDPSRPGLLGSEALAISLDKVLNERRTDVMKRVRYDIVNPRGEFEPHWWEAINAPMLDATGRVSAIIHQVHRVTELERAEQAEREAQERQAFLLKLTDALRPLADPMVIKETAARVLGEHLRARRVFYAEIEGGDWLIDRGYEEALAPVAEGRFPIDVFGGWVVDIFRKGQRLVARDLDADSRFDPSERSAYDSYHAHAIVAVPLIKKGELVALLAVHNATPREWTDLEVALVEETAERTWAAVERARAEAALTVSEANFRSMAHVVPDLLWYGEPDGSIIWFNERWMEYTGQRFEDAIGKGWMNVIHPEDREESARRYRESVELGRPREREHRMRRLDGEYRWFLVRTQPLLDESGRVVRMYGAATDVHAAHVARDALEARVAERTSELAAALENARSNEERLRLLLQQVPAMLWATDRELHVTRLMGADVPIAGGQKGGGTVDDLFADVDSAGMLALHRRVLAGTPAQFEFHIDRRTYEAHLEPLLDVDGETVGTIGVAHDATDRTLRRLQEDFIASVSHELQTPLTSIRAGLGLLDASIGATLGPAERELLGASRRNAERLRLEIGQLLAANQLTMSGPKVERSPIDLHELVDEAVRSLQSLLQEKDQIVNVDMPDRLEVEGDRRLLEQVLANLLSNAHRHTPPGTSIAVSGWFVGNDVRLAVHDTGPGIAPDQLEVIFQRFYRAPDSRREGIGLGLAITRDAVEAQGGRVWVESVLGQGTTFFVSLPRAGDTQSA